MIFHLKGIYYGLLYHKTCLGISIWPQEPLKTAKNVNFLKTKKNQFLVKIRAFLAPKCTKIVYHDVFWLHTLYVFGSSQFQKLLFSNLPKMAHFWLNRTCSVGGFTMCSTLLNKILQDLSSKIPPQKKVPWHRRSAALRRGSTGHFFQKNAFFGQKKAFFQKVHFIQKWSVTPNTIFEWVKNDFLFSNPKLVFFTEFNLIM